MLFVYPLFFDSLDVCGFLNWQKFVSDGNKDSEATGIAEVEIIKYEVFNFISVWSVWFYYFSGARVQVRHFFMRQMIWRDISAGDFLNIDQLFQ